jgi:putative membrane protein
MERKDLPRDFFYGALAGVTGAACMTPVRLAFRRAGLVDKTVPQAMEEKLAHTAKHRRGWLRREPRPEAHHAVDHLLHLGFGAALGGLFGLLTRRRRAGALARGLALGGATLLLGAGVVVPLIGAARPLWRARPSEQLVNLLAHLVFGVTTALVADELGTQGDEHRTTPDRHRQRTRVG